MKKFQVLLRTYGVPMLAKFKPSVLYEKVAVRPLPGWMLAAARNQIFEAPLGRLSPDTSLPVDKVVQPEPIVRP
jgi:hypothetical protein